MAEDALRKVCDVFVNLPTGFGKSVLFQALPVVYSHVQPSRETNIVIVVSPLVNLMKDQVSRLTSLGTSAVSPSDICSNEDIDQSKKEVIQSCMDHQSLGSVKRDGVRSWRAMFTKVQ